MHQVASGEVLGNFCFGFFHCFSLCPANLNQQCSSLKLLFVFFSIFHIFALKTSMAVFCFMKTVLKFWA